MVAPEANVPAHDRLDRPVFDAHLHIIDPRFPLVPNQGWLPEPFTCADYRKRTADLSVAGGAVVSASFQGFNQTWLVAALRCLGRGFVGVTQLPTSVSDVEICRLHAAGVRAVRFNLYRDGSANLDDRLRLAHRVYACAGWHAEFYIDSRDLAALESKLARLPRIVIDHLGMTDSGHPALLRLVEAGARVKASGFGRVRLNVADLLRQIAAINPAALMFGTDLPGTRARRPFKPADIDLVLHALGEKMGLRALLDNAREWYLRQE